MRKFLIRTLLLVLAVGGAFMWLCSDASVLAGATALGLDDDVGGLTANAHNPLIFNTMEAMGAGMLRVSLPFDHVVQAPGVYVWSWQDENGYRDYGLLFERLERSGIRPLVVLEGGPAYANHLYPQQPVFREALLESWADFVRTAVERYSSKVDFWQIGGNINDPSAWGWVLFPAAVSPQAPPDPELYSQMLKTAYAIIKSAQAGDSVLLGGLALGGDCAFHPLVYLQTLHNLDAWYAFDAINIELPALESSPESAQVDACGYLPVQSSGMPLADNLRAVGDFAKEIGTKPVWVHGLAFSEATLAAEAARRATLPQVVESDYLARATGILLGYGGAHKVFWRYSPEDGLPGAIALQSFANLNRALGGRFEKTAAGLSDPALQALRFRGSGRLTVLAWRSEGGEEALPTVVPDVDGLKIRAYSADAPSLKTSEGVSLHVDAGGDTALMVSERPVILSGHPVELKQSLIMFITDSASQAGAGLKAKLSNWVQGQKVKAADRVGAWVEEQQKSLMQTLKDSFNQWLRKSLGLA